MSIAIVVDMNLSAEWVALLTDAGWVSLHWSQVGDPRAEDTAIMDWARQNKQVVFTHDLDFGTALAMTHADGPSVIQVRGQRVLPEHIGDVVIRAVRKYEAELEQGALVIVEIFRSRVRILPF